MAKRSSTNPATNVRITINRIVSKHRVAEINENTAKTNATCAMTDPTEAGRQGGYS